MQYLLEGLDARDQVPPLHPGQIKNKTDLVHHDRTSRRLVLTLCQVCTWFEIVSM